MLLWPPRPCGAQEGHAATPGQVEGRPPVTEASPLQARIDAALPFDTVEVEAGEYVGDLVIDKPLRLRGHGRPRLLGSGRGSVVRIRAADVTFEGFELDGRDGGDLGRDSSGIHVAGAPSHHPRLSDPGRPLRRLPPRGSRSRRSRAARIRGIPGRDPGEKGSGIHAWNTDGFRCTGNEIVDTRDGFYIQSSSHGRISHNVARDLRYGLHYMFSDDNVFEDNLFENGAAGAALMYSRRIVFRRNRFLRNRGFASVGLLLKACDEVVAEDNLIADNARGIFLEGSYRNEFRRNVVAASDVAIVLYDSCGGNRFEGNSFVANLSPLQLVGRRTDTVFLGNYYSDADSPDLDGDGRADLPYRLSSVFDHLRGNLTAADLMAQGLAATALGIAERAFPVLEPVSVVDAAPLARPPVLPDVPAPPEGRARRQRGRPLRVARRPGRGGGPAAAGPSAAGEPAVISFRGFGKTFGTQAAVRGLDLEVARGEAVALLGPNGSGKTTCLKAAAGLVRPTSGSVSLGEPPRPAHETASARGSVVPAPARGLSRCALGARGARVLPRPARSAPGTCRRGASVRVPQRGGRPGGGHLFGGHGAAAGPGRGHDAGGQGPAPRRAHGRPRSRRSLRLLRPRGPTAPHGSDVALHLASSRRRRAPGRPLRGARGGTPRGLPDRGRAQGPSGRARACCGCGSRPRRRTFSTGSRTLAPVALFAADELVVPGPASSRPAVLDLVREAGAEVRGLTAEEGRLDDLYRELVADPEAGTTHERIPPPPGARGARRARRRAPRKPPGPAALDTRNERCRFCHMAVSDARTAGQIVAAGEEPLFFDDLGCLASYLAGQQERREGAVIYVADHRTKAWVRPPPPSIPGVPGLDTPMASHLVAHADTASRPADRGGSGRSGRLVGRRPRVAAEARDDATDPGSQRLASLLALRPAGDGPRGALAIHPGLRRGVRRPGPRHRRLGLRAVGRPRRAGLRAHGRLARPARGPPRAAGRAASRNHGLAPDRGAAELLLSQPVGRSVVLFGKLFGLFLALAGAQALGFGAAGLVIFSRRAADGLPGFLLLGAGGFVLTAVFLAVAAALVAGAFGRRRLRALAFAILVWFIVVVLFDVVALGVASAAPFGRGVASADRERARQPRGRGAHGDPARASRAAAPSAAPPWPSSASPKGRRGRRCLLALSLAFWIVVRPPWPRPLRRADL